MGEKSTGENSVQTHDRLLELSCEAYNRSDGELKGYDCPKCRNRGDFEEIRDGEIVRVLCDCRKKRKAMALLQASGLAEAVERMTLNNFQTPEEWQRDRKRRAVQFLTQDCGGWFAILGVTGSGKTHICTAICGELLRRGKMVRYVEWARFAQSLDRLYYDDSAFSDFYNPVRDVEVLYLDDFLKHENKGRALTFAFDLIDHRGKAGLQTIISGEMELAQIAALDTALAGRLVEFCGDYLFQNGKDPARNWRIRKK